MALRFSDAPEILDSNGKKEWARVSQQLNKLKFVEDVDYQIVTFYCLAFQDVLKYEAECKAGGDVITTEKGYQVKAPAATLKREALEMVLKFGRELGIGPCVRKRLAIAEQEAEDEFTAFLKKGKA
jgi:P27 family predicted phage terminase small subunit